MQLKKQAIRRQPTFDPVAAPHGVHRSSRDFNQENNTSAYRAACNWRIGQLKNYTPREMLALDCGRNAKDAQQNFLPMHQRGALPTIAGYNEMVNSGVICGPILHRRRGQNW